MMDAGRSMRTGRFCERALPLKIPVRPQSVYAVRNAANIIGISEVEPWDEMHQGRLAFDDRSSSERVLIPGAAITRHLGPYRPERLNDIEIQP
jgi:hypothetical protein